MTAERKSEPGRRPPSGSPYLFDAVLHPHRSLGPVGLSLLMVAIAAASFGAGSYFASAGAWPIFGFYGAGVALMSWAFCANHRSGRVYETILLTRDSLVIERVSARGRVRRWAFQPYWLRVEIDELPARDSRLTLRSHGRALTIGAFLSADERADFARELRAALARVRMADRT